MNERDYERLKKLAEDEYRKKIEALEIVWRMAKDFPQPPQRVVRRDAADGLGPRGKIAAAIVESLPKLPLEFTVKDVEPLVRAATSETLERSTISHALKRLTEAHLITVVQLGKGKRPTRYRESRTGNGVPPPSDSTIETHPATATLEQASKIRKLASSLKIEPEYFKTTYMQGHKRLSELPYRLAADLIEDLEAGRIQQKEPEQS